MISAPIEMLIDDPLEFADCVSEYLTNYVELRVSSQVSSGLFWEKCFVNVYAIAKYLSTKSFEPPECMLHAEQNIVDDELQSVQRRNTV